MYEAKSRLRKRLLIKRKKFFSNKFNLSYYEILKLIRKENRFKKKISVAGYYPVNFEVNILHILSIIYHNVIVLN